MRLILIFSLTASRLFGQWIVMDRVDESKVDTWTPKFTLEYRGVYHFGVSENESDLTLIFSLGKIYGQIRSGLWTGKEWVSKFENIDDIKIIGNKFYSSKSNGEFVLYDNGKEKIKGLKIYKTWSDIPSGSGQYEIGVKQSGVDDMYQGKFTQASLRLLDKEELEKMDKADLKLMRNEIYARYHLKFAAGGQMETYFKKEGWYRGHYDNVDNFLTGLEKENVRLIKEIESK